jgi:hypothetical protein
MSAGVKKVMSFELKPERNRLSVRSARSQMPSSVPCGSEYKKYPGA